MKRLRTPALQENKFTHQKVESNEHITHYSRISSIGEEEVNDKAFLSYAVQNPDEYGSKLHESNPTSQQESSFGTADKVISAAVSTVGFFGIIFLLSWTHKQIRKKRKIKSAFETSPSFLGISGKFEESGKDVIDEKRTTYSYMNFSSIFDQSFYADESPSVSKTCSDSFEESFEESSNLSELEENCEKSVRIENFHFSSSPKKSPSLKRFSSLSEIVEEEEEEEESESVVSSLTGISFMTTLEDETEKIAKEIELREIEQQNFEPRDKECGMVIEPKCSNVVAHILKNDDQYVVEV